MLEPAELAVGMRLRGGGMGTAAFKRRSVREELE